MDRGARTRLDRALRALARTRRSRTIPDPRDSARGGPDRARVGGAGVRPLARRALAALLVLAFALPLAAGAVGTLLPALGLAPAIAPVDTAADGAGEGAATGAAFAALLADPRLPPAILLSLKTGLAASALALLLTLLTLVSVHGTRPWRWTLASLPPLLAVPHAALAVGLAFLIAPSGFLVRLLSPATTGWTRPPSDWVVPDAGGWSLVAGLVVKETPFLLLAAAAQLRSLDVDAALRIGRTLGYAPARCWSRLVLPRLYPRIRLTVLIVLVFNLSVVDMAILLGPGNPPTLALLALALVNDPGSRAAASAAALLLVVLVAVVLVAALLLERLVMRVAARRRRSGARGLGLAGGRRLGQGVALALSAVSVGSLAMLPLWSLAERWRFPDTWPSAWTTRHWTARTALFAEPALATIAFALVSASLALVAAIAWLELERRGDAPRIDWLWYVPLLVPQTTLLFGWQAAALALGVDGAWATVVHAHWLYALPYVVLILAVAWREHDPAWTHAAAVLGAGYWRVLWRVRLPLLARPLAQAAAVAVAVSVAQYLPTLLLGAGRHQTLAIELVTSFGGVDRRVIAVLAVLQSLLPLVAFVAALAWPQWRTRRLRSAVERATPARV